MCIWCMKTCVRIRNVVRFRCHYVEPCLRFHVNFIFVLNTTTALSFDFLREISSMYIKSEFRRVEQRRFIFLLQRNVSKLTTMFLEYHLLM